MAGVGLGDSGYGVVVARCIYRGVLMKRHCFLHVLSSSRSRTGLLHMSIRISKRSSNSPQLMPKRAETTEVSIGEIQTVYI